MTSSGIPFVELYRPKNFEEIVLDSLNRQILKNIIETDQQAENSCAKIVFNRALKRLAQLDRGEAQAFEEYWCQK